MRKRDRKLAALAMGAAMIVPTGFVQASSHREAPFITRMPKVDASDFYAFNSYETGRTGNVTLLANYEPLQDPDGGPNFYQLDPDALYEIMVDNNGDGKEDVTFQFRFTNTNNNVGLDIGPTGNTKHVAIPLINAGPLNGTGGSTANLNETETYSLNVVTGDRRTGTVNAIAPPSGSSAFTKPVDNIGAASFPGGYEAYAKAYQYSFAIPTIPGTTGCTSATGKVFVGQRAEGFAVNLGTIFDLLGNSTGVFNIITNGFDRPHRGLTPKGSTPTGTGATAVVTPPSTATASSLDLGLNSLGHKNVTTIALEIPAACLATSATATDPGAIIGSWTTASVRQARVINPNGTFATPAKDGGAWTQVSRLGMPLVNEAVIGLKDKDLFNTSKPSGDAQYADYITNPVLPKFINLIYGATAGANIEPQVFPRTDLVTVFAQGIPGVNQANPAALWEYQRLNTATGTTAVGTQSSLGALNCFQAGVLTPGYMDTNAGDSASTKVDNSCDVNGFPNGRRPGDDVTDITIRAAMGYIIGNSAMAAAYNVPFTDFAINFDDQFGGTNPPNTSGGHTTNVTFPYLNTPYGGE